MEYELLISRTSPACSKIQALMGYAGFPHRVRVQNMVTRYGVNQRLTGQTRVPVLRRGGWAINDSAKIAAYIMERSRRPLLPEGPGRLLALFFESFADDWVRLWVLESRWSHGGDAREVSERLGEELLGGHQLGAGVLGRRVAARRRRRHYERGVRPENGEALRSSALRCLDGLEAILAKGAPYLFGGSPTVADFSFFGALSQLQQGRSGRFLLRAYPEVRAFLHRLEGALERPARVDIRQVAPRDLSELQPLFGELMGTYWPVLVGNYRSQVGGRPAQEIRVRLLDGGSFVFQAGAPLQERLEQLVAYVDATYAAHDLLFGVEGMRMERALIGQIAELARSEAGRGLLRGYPHLGLH